MNNPKTIYYWSPFISKVATIKAVYNSVNSINKYSNNKLSPKIIDVYGEWESYKYFNQKKNNFYSLSSLRFINKFSSLGFIKSRLKYILIFLLCFFPLKKFLSNEKPDFLIIHLITSLPLFLNLLFKFQTKFILRISGKPKLNFIRFFFWKIALKKIFKITFPTLETMNYFKSLNIVKEEKLSLLYDPIISINEINRDILDKDIDEKLKDKNFFLSIGRLTKQKNFGFLIDCFNELIKKDNSINLVIIGEGEDYIALKKKIDKHNLKKNIYLIGFKNNVFKYLKKCEAFILSSLWEDPGFVIVEAMYSNSFVISSDCESGPKEIISNDRGILFKNNSKDDFIEKFSKFIQLENKERMNIKLNAKKFTKEFSLLKHYKKIESILSL